MKRFLLLFALSLLAHSAFAYNPFWVTIDKLLIKQIVKLDKTNPQTVEHYFLTENGKKNIPNKENLGFGWTRWTPRVGGGYIDSDVCRI